MCGIVKYPCAINRAPFRFMRVSCTEWDALLQQPIGQRCLSLCSPARPNPAPQRMRQLAHSQSYHATSEGDPSSVPKTRPAPPRLNHASRRNQLSPRDRTPHRTACASSPPTKAVMPHPSVAQATAHLPGKPLMPGCGRSRPRSDAMPAHILDAAHIKHIIAVGKSAAMVYNKQNQR